MLSCFRLGGDIPVIVAPAGSSTVVTIITIRLKKSSGLYMPWSRRQNRHLHALRRRPAGPPDQRFTFGARDPLRDAPRPDLFIAAGSLAIPEGSCDTGGGSRP